MGFRANGTAVVRTVAGEDVGYALAFSPDAARKIADALNALPGAGGVDRVDPLTGQKADLVDVHDARALSDVIGKGKLVRIVGPMATATMGTPDGRQVRSLAEGAILPADVSAGHARHLISVGLAEVVEDKPEPKPSKAAESPKPEGEPAAGGEQLEQGAVVSHPDEGTTARRGEGRTAAPRTPKAS